MFSLLVRMNSTPAMRSSTSASVEVAIQRDAGQHAFELRGVEVVVTDGAEIQKYGSHPVP